MIGPNLGMPWGYYGDLNRTKSRLEAIDGVSVESEHGNYDLSVESFWFEVVVDDVHHTQLFFPEGCTRAQCFRIVDNWEKNELPGYRTGK
jgi:hypothetical protein